MAGFLDGTSLMNENRMKAPPARAVPKPCMRRVLSTTDAGEQFSIGILVVSLRLWCFFM